MRELLAAAAHCFRGRRLCFSRPCAGRGSMLTLHAQPTAPFRLFSHLDSPAEFQEQSSA